MKNKILITILVLLVCMFIGVQYWGNHYKNNYQGLLQGKSIDAEVKVSRSKMDSVEIQTTFRFQNNQQKNFIKKILGDPNIHPDILEYKLVYYKKELVGREIEYGIWKEWMRGFADAEINHLGDKLSVNFVIR